MANLTTTISVQVDAEDKKQVTEVLKKLGVSLSGLINMTIKQVIMRNSIPFEVSIPESTNLLQYFSENELDKTSKELTYIEKHPEEYQSYDSVDDLKEALLSDE